MPSKRQRQRRKERNELEREQRREEECNENAAREVSREVEGSVKQQQQAHAAGTRRKDAGNAGKRAEDDAGVEGGEQSERESSQGVVAGPKIKQRVAREVAYEEVLREHNFESEVEDPRMKTLISEAADMKMKRINEARKKRKGEERDEGVDLVRHPCLSNKNGW